MILDFFKIEFDKNRVYGLDILRAFAILFVVFGHGTSYLPPEIGRFQEYFIWDGVSIFFVLSGFLIGGILIKVLEKEGASFRSLFTFWTRRWLRTLPAYFFVLILLSFLFYFLEPNFTFWETKRYYFFIQNLNVPHPGFFAEAWSLSIEEWFYLLSPSMIFIFRGFFQFSSKNAILLTVIIIITMTIGFRYYRYSTMHILTMSDWDGYFRKQVITRLDSLMFGVIGAYVAYFHNGYWYKYEKVLLKVGLGIMILQQVYSTLFVTKPGIYECVFSFSITAIGTLFLLPYLSGIKKGEGVWFRILTFVSLISYSMYLLNLSVVQWIALRHIDFYDLSGLPLIMTKYVLFWMLTILGSILLYKYVEKPFINLRKRIS